MTNRDHTSGEQPHGAPSAHVTEAVTRPIFKKEFSTILAKAAVGAAMGPDNAPSLHESIMSRLSPAETRRR
jgi:hypothetical protein